MNPLYEELPDCTCSAIAGGNITLIELLVGIAVGACAAKFAINNPLETATDVVKAYDHPAQAKAKIREKAFHAISKCG